VQVLKAGAWDLFLVKLKLAPPSVTRPIKGGGEEVINGWDMEWPRAFIAAGTPVAKREQSDEQRMAEAEAQANSVRRVATVYGKDRRDGGTAVHGKKGLQMGVFADEFIKELMEETGGPSSFQIIHGKGDAPFLELAFSKTAPKASIPAEARGCLTDYVSRELASFGYVMWFDNPPDDEKGVVITVTFDRRQDCSWGRCFLHLNNGLSNIEPTSVH
jgi:hypothetical protein